MMTIDDSVLLDKSNFFIHIIIIYTDSI